MAFTCPHSTSIEEEQDMAFMGTHSTSIEEEQDIAFTGNHSISIEEEQDMAFMGTHSTSIHEGQDMAFTGTHSTSIEEEQSIMAYTEWEILDPYASFRLPNLFDDDGNSSILDAVLAVMDGKTQKSDEQKASVAQKIKALGSYKAKSLGSLAFTTKTALPPKSQSVSCSQLLSNHNTTQVAQFTEPIEIVYEHKTLKKKISESKLVRRMKKTFSRLKLRRKSRNDQDEPSTVTEDAGHTPMPTRKTYYDINCEERLI